MALVDDVATELKYENSLLGQDLGYLIGYIQAGGFFNNPSDADIAMARGLRDMQNTIETSVAQWNTAYGSYKDSPDETVAEKLSASGQQLISYMKDFIQQVNAGTSMELFSSMKSILGTIVGIGVDALNLVKKPLLDVGNLAMLIINNLVPILIIVGVGYVALPHVMRAVEGRKR